MFGNIRGRVMTWFVQKVRYGGRGTIELPWGGPKLLVEGEPLKLLLEGEKNKKMTVLTKMDKTEMRRDYFQIGKGKEEFKGSNPSLNGSELLAVLQAIEDKWENGRIALKADIDTAAGKTLTNAQAKVLGRAWLRFKAGIGG